MEDTLRKLTEVFGPSGEEESIRDTIRKMVEKKVDQVYEDTLGNLFVIKKGGQPKIMISAHMDEIGVIVTHIDENGFLRIAPVGGISPGILIGKRLRFAGGHVGTVNHEEIKDCRDLDWSKIYLDMGQKDSKAAEKMASIGDLAVPDFNFQKLSGGRYISKAMDNRAGCAVLVEAIKRLPDNLPQEVCFLFSVQEEVGLRGAKTAAYSYDPDYALAVDVTDIGDTPKSPTMAVSLGKGPAVKVKDSSVLCHPLIRKFMIETAIKNKIPYQLEVLERGGTDAGAIHISREGVPSGALSVPCRYIHSPSEMVDGSDLDQSINLLTKLLSVSWPLTEDFNVR
ncbi:MAG: M42 family metallopeptidase [Bacillota bacterium]|nr:M42 family metallopeptidase [Bacillota bacterium]